MGIAIATIAGVNSAYENIHGVDIFDDINLPENIDKDILVNNIMLKAMEFSLLHVDPDILHYQILNFFDVNYSTFDRWNKALLLEYDPIENYDRHEKYTGLGTNSNSGTTSMSTSNSGTDSNTITLRKAAFNTSSYENYDQTGESGSTNSNSSGSTNESGNGSFTEEHQSRIHGNIGVTTSQQMIESEIDLYTKYNIYDMISNKFNSEFCIMVY